jgi:hypothetical protein
MMRARVWFDLPWVTETEGRKFQNLLENHVQQNDRDYILTFLANLPQVNMYIAEDCIPDKEPPT